MQAELSDIQAGDVLIAIDQYNVSSAPAKATQRLMSNLPWPRILVFETRTTRLNEDQVVRKKESLTFNLTIVYPPSLIGSFEIRGTDWTPSLSSMDGSLDECAMFVVRAPDDQFGCKVNATEYALNSNITDIIGQRGFVTRELEEAYPMIAILVQEAYKQGIKLSIKSLAMMKRGSCTFVEKAKTVAILGAHAGLLVNNENVLFDVPCGKEETANCTAPFGVISEGNGVLVHLTAMKQEVIGIVSSSSGPTSTCSRALSLSQDILNRWAHTQPHVPVTEVVNSPPVQARLRGPTDEGGRIAVSGENGWAYFDYHLAMFGEQEVPDYAMKILIADPIHGCDPNNYRVRIAGTAHAFFTFFAYFLIMPFSSGSIVAILRGGGCSFGIKVLNAQKLGAKAVVIMNTDDKQTMRLMAQPDEIPLMNISCIMVSRRLQYYIEKQLKPFYLNDQHVALIQPTGVFGEYEKKNVVDLPERLPSR